MLNTVSLADFVFHVADQRITDLADSTFIDRRVPPGIMSELRVDRHSDHLDAPLLEFRHPLVKSDQLRRADKGKIERIKEENRFFAFDMIAQRVFIDNFA